MRRRRSTKRTARGGQMQMNGLIPSAWIDDVYAAALGDQRWETVLDGLRSCVGVRMVTLLSFDDAARVPAIEQAAGDDASWVAACYHTYNTEFYRYDRSCRSPPTGRRAAGSRTSSTCPRTSAHSAFYQEFLHPFGRQHFGPVHPSQRGRAHSSAWAASNRRLSDDQRHAIENMGMHISRALQIQARIGGSRRAWPPPNRRSMRCRCPSSCSARSVSCTRIARPIS